MLIKGKRKEKKKWNFHWVQQALQHLGFNDMIQFVTVSEVFKHDYYLSLAVID